MNELISRVLKGSEALVQATVELKPEVPSLPIEQSHSKFSAIFLQILYFNCVSSFGPPVPPSTPRPRRPALPSDVPFCLNIVSHVFQ